jgi:hypothetical protein
MGLDPKLLHDLTITAVNNIIIAAIVATFGLYVNHALERYKARATFLASYAGKHITAISDAWTRMYEWEDFVRRTFRYQRIYTDEQWHVMMDDLSDAIDESRRLELAVRKFVEINRFWLGEQLYGLLVTYHNGLETYVRTALYGTYSELEYLRTCLTESKQDIMSVLRVDQLST